MSRREQVRNNWRIAVLVVVVVVSAAALFVPGATLVGGGGNSTAADGPTNLQYGLELSGGTQVRAPLVGSTAENLDIGTNENESNAVAANVTETLGVTGADVEVRVGNGSATVEVFVPNVSDQEFVDALGSAGVDASTSDIRDGVTDATRQEAANVIRNKVSRAGLSGGTVQTVGGEYIQVEVPNQNRSEVIDIVGDRGQVRTVAYFPYRGGGEPPDWCGGPLGNPNAEPTTRGNTTYCNVTVTQQGDFASIDPVAISDAGQPFVRVTLSQSAGAEFASDMRRFGFADPANGTCAYGQGGGHCLNTVTDGEVVYSSGVKSGLAREFADDDFAQTPVYRTLATNRSEAEELRINLQTGALPAALDVQGVNGSSGGGEGTTQYILPSLAQDFKFYSLVTGLAAVLAVSITVFIRYREPRVAAPMVVTALSEVFILLGFAAAIGLALDLSHIAGLIAVVGTGVDDLVIIADEILQNDVRTDRVFRNRFRKAFWVIGAAAATTIIAMGPLAVLSLGDLQGFAIVTIAGVLIGVLLTRPAYGDILRSLTTD